jgi:hypothetical protein
LAEKQAYRARQAEKLGKAFTPGVKPWKAKRTIEDARTGHIREATWDALARRNASEAWEWWLERAPEWWARARADLLSRLDTVKYREQYHSDPAYRQREIDRVAERKRKRGRFDEHVRRVIRGKTSDGKMRKLIGYGREELLAHLRQRFTDGMTMDALLSGAIHIDHDEPVSRFDPKNLVQLRMLWRLENVQPLWASENARKAARTMVEWRAAQRADDDKIGRLAA